MIPTHAHTHAHRHAVFIIPTDDIPVRIALVFLGRADLTTLSMRGDSVASLLKAALMSGFHKG